MIDDNKESEKSSQDINIAIRKNISIQKNEKQSMTSDNRKNNEKRKLTNSKKFEEDKSNKKSDAFKNELNSLKNNSNSEIIKNKANNVIKYKNKQNAGRKESREFSKKLSFLSDKDEINDQNEDGDINFRQRLTRFLELHDRLFYIKLIIYILSFLSFIYYAVCTYIKSLFPSLNYIDFFICTIYIFEHLINIILAHHFFLYIFSVESLTSFLLEIPPFFSLLCKDYYLDSYYRFINVTRVMRLLKATDILDLFWSGEKNVNSQIINIITTLVSIVLVWGGIIQMLDLGYVETNLKITFDILPRRNLLLRRHFHHYIYFVIVSLTTVGYGEIIPQSIFGQFMIIFLVVVILVVVPDKTSELINLSNAQTIYERKQYISSPEVPYVVILGNIELESLKSFCKEYFHKDHGDGYKHIVILVNKPPNKSIELYLNQKDNSKFIIYLQGDPMNSSDLLRTDLLNAKSCIIFTNKNSKDPSSGDHQSLLLAIFIKKFYYHMILEKYFDKKKEEHFITKTSYHSKKTSIFKSNKNAMFRICLQLNKPESTSYYYSTLHYNYRKNMLPDKLLIIESLKMNLLSKSCLTPGIIALISNLVVSSAEERSVFKNEPEWLKEYREGQQYEIYKYNGVEGNLLFYSFQKLTQEIYNKFHCIILALEINYQGSSLVKLNPQSKENLIDIIYPSLLSKTKNSSGVDIINNYEEKEDESLLGGLDIDQDENNFRKFKNNINFKNLKINLYCISSDKNIVDDIKKLDEGKPKNVLRRTISRHSSNNDKLSFSSNKKKSSNKRIITKNNQYYSESDSDFSDDNDGEDSVKFLVDHGNNQRIHEDDLSMNYYTLEGNEKNYLYTNEIMRQGIKDRTDIKNHIIICGVHHELIHFILPLRSKYLPENLLKWIVILAPALPQDIHDTLVKFPKVIFIQGDPLYPENLFRANITTADIAVILCSFTLGGNNIKENELNEIIGREADDINGEEDEGSDKNNHKKFDEEIIDAKTLFIYKSIKKLNNSIQIITELLSSKNIEFLLSTRDLKKLYNNPLNKSENIKKNKDNQTQISEEDENGSDNLHYEHTPIYAAGEVYLPSLVDKITCQMHYNSNLLTILDLLLIGERPPEKKIEKKLAQMFDLQGSNLFLIPCEPRNESFSDMFKRLLSKYNMISIALYRKNVQENCYYVYTNPKKTSLIRETDMVFVLSNTENIMSIYSKNLLGVNTQQKYFDSFFNNEEKNEKSDNNNLPFFKVLHDSVQQKLKENVINNNALNNKTKDNNISAKNSKDNNEIKNAILSNIFKDNKGGKSDKKEKRNSVIGAKGEEKELKFKKGKYAEIDNMQDRLDKASEKLKIINDKYENIESDISHFVKEEIVNELLVYVSKTGKK